MAGKESFLALYTDGRKSFFERAAKLRKTVGDDPAQVKLLSDAEATIQTWQAVVTEPTIALRREIGDAKTMADFSAEESELMEVRKAANDNTVATTFAVIALCVGIALLLGIGLAWLIGSGIAKPITRTTETMRKLAQGTTR